uniref:Uncharacterized protein n=1 Tax=Lepeophtheirus salmonis TaxID=72036 RepID=A0A0K2T239_LEPSM
MHIISILTLLGIKKPGPQCIKIGQEGWCT